MNRIKREVNHMLAEGVANRAITNYVLEKVEAAEMYHELHTARIPLQTKKNIEAGAARKYAQQISWHKTSKEAVRTTRNYIRRAIDHAIKNRLVTLSKHATRV